MDQRGQAWWLALVYVVVAFNIAGIFLIGLRTGLAFTPTLVFLAGGILGIAGLRLRSSNKVLGSWFIIAACIPPLLPYWLVIPAVISLVTIIGGLVTRELEVARRV